MKARHSRYARYCSSAVFPRSLWAAMTDPDVESGKRLSNLRGVGGESARQCHYKGTLATGRKQACGWERPQLAPFHRSIGRFAVVWNGSGTLRPVPAEA